MKFVFELETDNTGINETLSIANEYFRPAPGGAMTVEVDDEPIELVVIDGVWRALDTPSE